MIALNLAGGNFPMSPKKEEGNYKHAVPAISLRPVIGGRYFPYIFLIGWGRTR